MGRRAGNGHGSVAAAATRAVEKPLRWVVSGFVVKFICSITIPGMPTNLPAAANSSPPLSFSEVQDMGLDQLRPVIEPDRIRMRVEELAADVSRDLVGEVPLMIGILKGAFIFMADLVRAMTIPVEIDFAEISSYGSGTDSTGRIRIIKDIATPVAGRHVLIVEDIIDTGLTLKRYMEEIWARGPASLRLCALLNKTQRTEYNHIVDYQGFEVPGGFLVGYGLDWGGRYRELPGIYQVEEGA